MKTYKIDVGPVVTTVYGVRRVLELTPPLQIDLLSQVALYDELRAGESVLHEAGKGQISISGITYRDAQEGVLIEKLKSLGYTAQ